MGTRVFLAFVLLALYGFCIPLYKKLNPAGFLIYLIWVLVIGAIWIFFVFGTNVIA